MCVKHANVIARSVFENIIKTTRKTAKTNKTFTKMGAVCFRNTNANTVSNTTRIQTRWVGFVGRIFGDLERRIRYEKMRGSKYFGGEVYRKIDPIDVVSWSDPIVMLSANRTKYWFESFPRRRFVPREPGVYQLLVNESALYIGSTSNLRRRFKSYQANGSHLARRIEKALKKHDRVWFRFFVDRGHKFTERRARECFAFDWNRA